MLLVLKYFAFAFSALLPLINPLGSAIVFLGLVGNAPPEVFRKLSRRIAITTTLFLLVIELVGAALLRFFGISLPVVQVAGGFVLAAMGWGLLNNSNSAASKEKSDVVTADFRSLDEKVFFPFTFPVTAGPGTIVVMLTLNAHASQVQVVDDFLSHLGIFLAAVLLSFGVYLCYRYAPRITQKIAPQTVNGILRVVAFILLCIGVQIAWNGLKVLIKTVQ
ncbi:MAG TPA: MarC family protein [Terriglobales bacterium]|nr:MarC family protein [Terriglobales bacterium]